ncbi:hypothetical protein AAF712_006530 [Marasmius tenuissimus]|uniref:Uncharacterized protein n=1 Tax=Marasmius tenuissimus TaxID=585030 RepID=A0ABR2ZZL5_9AGAR
MISCVYTALTALNLDLNGSSVNIRDILVLVIALAAVAALVVGGPYTPYTPSELPFPVSYTHSSLPITDDVQPTASLECPSSRLVDDSEPDAQDVAPLPANQDDSLWPAADAYKTGLGLTFEDPDSVVARRMNMVALHTIVYDMDDDFFDFVTPRAGHVKGVESEELLLDDSGVDSGTGLASSSSLGYYWDSMGASEREFRWKAEYGDDSWLFDRPAYEEKSVWRRVRSGLKKRVLRRRF